MSVKIKRITYPDHEMNRKVEWTLAVLKNAPLARSNSIIAPAGEPASCALDAATGLYLYHQFGGVLTMPTRMIQLEFNELSPTLMTKFMREGHLPNFQKLHDSSAVFVTDAGEDPPNLEPWIQWVTVHTGLPFSEHKVFDLGDGHKLNVPRVWDTVGEAGAPVWICGSMNASFRKPIQGFILPDPWTTGIQPYPDNEFDAFFHFVRTHVQEHTRPDAPLSKADQLRFIAFMVKRGMSAETVGTIIQQLLAERSSGGRWKRAVILDRLMWDVFAWYWKHRNPVFSTFFLNSTAHFQHMYWRNMQPEAFAVKPGADEQDEYAGAVLYGYQQMDAIVGKCLEMAGPDTAVVLATALSQQPCLKYEDTGGKTFHRPLDPERLFAFAGVAAKADYAPVMSEQFHLYFKTPAEAAQADAKLQALRLDGRPVMMTRCNGNEVFAGCNVFTNVEGAAEVRNEAGQSKRFADLFYNCNLVKSGMHHRDGIFWMRVPGQPHKIHADRVPLTRVAPTLLAVMGYPHPDFMRESQLLEPAYA
jgi:hypothetical protein